MLQRFRFKKKKLLKKLPIKIFLQV